MIDYPTNRLRWVYGPSQSERPRVKEYLRYGDGEPVILQQWWQVVRTDEPNPSLSGEWRDVPLSKEDDK